MKRIKLMCALEESVLWDMETNKKIPLKRFNFPQELRKRVELWTKEARRVEDNWLNNDEPDGLFNIKSNLNKKKTKLCNEINKVLKNVKCYTWFDVDRSVDKNENFVWKKCPNCKGNLTSTGLNNINKYVCEKCNILLPSEG